MTNSGEKKMELRVAVIECLKESNKSLTHIEIFFLLLLKNHISKKDKTFSKKSEIERICESLANEGMFIKKEGRFSYNNEFKEEIVKKAKGTFTFNPFQNFTDSIKQLEKNNRVSHFLDMNHEIFSTLLITYLLLLLAETIWEGRVSSFMDINYLLAIIIVSGSISVLTRREEEKVEKVDMTKKDYFYILGLGITGAIIVWYKIQDIGNLSYLISGITGILIILLSTLLFDEEETMVDISEIIRIIFGSVFVLFLPGFAWSFVFFKKDEIDWIERIALSFGLSIALVPLAVFWLNYFLGVKINFLNVSLVILLLTGTAAAIFMRKGKYTLSDLYNLKKHELSKKPLIIVGSAIFLIILVAIFGSISQLPPSNLPLSDASVVNVTDTSLVETTQVSPFINVTGTPLAPHETNALPPLITPVREPHKYSIRITMSDGFIPDVVTLNESDIVTWSDEENQRYRLVLISKDGLFENKVMQYTNKYSYQFNSSGNYRFVIAEFNSLNEYPKATFNVIVN